MWLSIYYLYCLARSTPSPAEAAIQQQEANQEHQHREVEKKPFHRYDVDMDIALEPDVCDE
ncbi:MAG: hypothetical protein Q9P90_10765 [candidate division KSB1 bacterium]|nr:hypothetical protein [candidate division KSB1 bacterium]